MPRLDLLTSTIASPSIAVRTPEAVASADGGRTQPSEGDCGEGIAPATGTGRLESADRGAVIVRDPENDPIAVIRVGCASAQHDPHCAHVATVIDTSDDRPTALSAGHRNGAASATVGVVAFSGFISKQLDTVGTTPPSAEVTTPR